jgi:cold shock CspA family protein
MAKSDNNFQKNTTFFIDGTNLCYWQDTTQPSINVLLELLCILKKDKDFSFYCIFDANTHYKLPLEQREAYQKLLEYKEYFYQVTGGKKADDFILELADSYSAPVISNDNYNDPHYSKYRWKERDFTPKRLFMGEVIPLKGNTHLIVSDLDIHIKVNNSTEELLRNLAQVIQKPTQKQRGRIKFFNAAENWGLIVYETDLYFQQPPGMTDIQDAYEVEFTIGSNDRGPCADNISIPPASNKNKTMIGVIENYDDLKTFGYIRSGESAELLFFYKSYVPNMPNDGLYRGMAVEFIPSENKNGKCAREIRIIPETEELKQLRRKVTELENLLKVRDNTISQYKRIKPTNEDSELIDLEKNIPNGSNQVVLNREQQTVLPNNNDNIPLVKEPKQLQLIRKNEIPAENKETPQTDAKREQEVPVVKNTTENTPIQISKDKKEEIKRVNLPSPQQKKDMLLNRNKQNAPSNNNKSAKQPLPLPETKTPTAENTEEKAPEEVIPAKIESPKQIVLKRANLVKEETETKDNSANENITETPLETAVVEPASIEKNTATNDDSKNKGKKKETAKKGTQTKQTNANAKQQKASSTNTEQISPPIETTETKIEVANVPEANAPIPEKTTKQPNKKTPAKTSKKTNLKSVLKQKIDNLVAKAEKEIGTHTPNIVVETAKTDTTKVAESLPETITANKPSSKKGKATKANQLVPEQKTTSNKLVAAKANPIVIANEPIPDTKAQTPVVEPKAKTTSKSNKKEKTTTTVTTPKNELAVEKTTQEPTVETEKVVVKDEPLIKTPTNNTQMVKTTIDTPANVTTTENKDTEIVTATTETTTTEVTSVDTDKTPKTPVRFATAEYFNDPEKRTFWWASLQPQWRMAFNVFLEKGEILDLPTDEDLKQIFATKRFSFHHATKNRLSYKLNNLQGIQHLTNITELNISEHAIKSTKGIEHLDKINYLGCSRNELTSLEGVEMLKTLKQLYIAKNNISGDEIVKTVSQIHLNLLDCRENNLPDASKKQLQTLNIKEIKL